LASVNLDAARDMLAALLTQANGEYVFRVPPRTELYLDDLTDETPNWTGIGRYRSYSGRSSNVTLYAFMLYAQG
jgi:hypothetical protein